MYRQFTGNNFYRWLHVKVLIRKKKSSFANKIFIFWIDKVFELDLMEIYQTNILIIANLSDKEKQTMSANGCFILI